MISSRHLTSLALLSMLLGASAASADIAVFTDGRSLKVASYEVKGDSIELVLQSKGKLEMPMTRIDRIISDEVIVPVAEVKELPKLFPARSWRYDESIKPLFDSKYNKIIVAAARKHNVDAALISAVIKAESDYDAKTLSNKGAQGLMQLMPATAERFGVSNAFDPEQNIYGGVKYLRWLLDKFEGNAELVVAAYNAGEGNVWKYNGVPPFRETVNYVRRIARRFAPAAVETTATVSLVSNNGR